MNVLIVGAGGREHALAWKLSKSPLLEKLYCAPGNPGIAKVADCVVLEIEDHNAVAAFCVANGIDLVVVGPEVPLVAGLADDLENAGIATFGPSARASQLEGSKGFTKDLCAAMNIPTAAYHRFTDAPAARAYASAQPLPLVIKADGLAAGKGVVIAETLEQACTAIDHCFEGEFGAAGAELVIEAFLSGEEASMFFLCDGETALPFGSAQDHKQLGEGDVGPNTGGMGAYSPAAVMSDEIISQTIEQIIEPTLKGMREMGAPFKGILFAGLMIDDDGAKLIEYNVRFGDPECQVLMMRLMSDLLPLLMATVEGKLAGQELRWSSDTALTVVLASRGYPGAYDKGTIIEGAETLDDDRHRVFHAGTSTDKGKLVATGGRVLNVTALGKSTRDAQSSAYQMVDQIDWPNGFCRRDIGWRAIDRA